MNKDSLCMNVKGVQFPYKLEKNIYFINSNTIRLEYNLTNESDFDFEFLWAGHFMLNMEEGTKIVVPDDCRKAITILTNGNGKFGDVNDWPLFKDKNGIVYRADISRSAESKGFEKYYFQNKLTNGWCELLYPGNKNRLKISFPVETVPYLGILMNENGWDDLYNIFIEPCTVCYDRPDIARQHGQVSKVEAFGTYNWYLDLNVN